MNQLAQIVSIQVGLPRAWGDACTDVASSEDFDDAASITGFFKRPVEGSASIGRLGVAGDGQADLRNHGGIDKAVLGYSADHFAAWRTECDWPELVAGGFAENLTLAGVVESSVCLGDIWRTGDALLQISQPRRPCWKLARRWRRPDLPKRVIESGRTGWYFRVLQEGTAQVGDFELVDRPCPLWTIARCNTTFYGRNEEAKRGDVAELRSLALLADSWRNDLRPG